ncbi:hypothetical protein N8D56_25935 (plasmid) [Devosia sp. A8/3-2]|nr:hypothetical protein N8D56_25935 [Devosia sp. A8/3-2]
MDLIVTNTAIITGDGTTIHPNGHIGIADGKIAAISVGQEQLSMSGIPRLDARGATSFQVSSTATLTGVYTDRRCPVAPSR